MTNRPTPPIPLATQNPVPPGQGYTAIFTSEDQDVGGARSTVSGRSSRVSTGSSSDGASRASPARDADANATAAANANAGSTGHAAAPAPAQSHSEASRAAGQDSGGTGPADQAELPSLLREEASSSPDPVPTRQPLDERQPSKANDEPLILSHYGFPPRCEDART